MSGAKYQNMRKKKSVVVFSRLASRLEKSKRLLKSKLKLKMSKLKLKVNMSIMTVMKLSMVVKKPVIMFSKVVMMSPKRESKKVMMGESMPSMVVKRLGIKV